MPSVTLYAKPSGLIVGRGTRDEQGFVSFDTDDMGSVEGLYASDTHYIADGVAVLRPAFTPTLSANTVVANETATVTIGNLPDGTLASVDGAAPVGVVGGAIDFVAAVAGDYVIGLECWPYRPVTVTIHATPAP